MQVKQEGFEESDEERLASKQVDKNPNELVSTFFVIPEAKPLLSKQIIDYSKPKVLIKEVDIHCEPPQLLSSNLHKEVLSADRPHNAKAISTKNLPLSTLWEKYVLSQNYSILYLKYYREDVDELQKRGFKKLKLELLKLCRNQPFLLSTYIVDLGFLSDAGTYLLRNLKPTTFEEINSEPFDHNIKFDSHFQCGNLYAVFEKKPIPSPTQNSGPDSTPLVQQFDLILQNDINSKGFSNWFYFNLRCKNKTAIKFNIVNMQKAHSLYTQGMKVVAFSMRRFQKQKLQWHHDGFAYSYYRNQLRKNAETEATYNTLTFTYEVKYDDDLIYFAATLPYSYSKLLKFIESVEKVAKLNTNIYFKKESAGSSISSNVCPVLTLTWKREKKKDQKRKRKKIIGVIGRQHPCETVSSYVVEGFINSLIYLNSQSAVQLLQNYIFKIVPMINVDGVIYGNSRCDICGNDINRKWTKNPNKFIYPIISGVKNMFNRLIQDEYEIDYFIDLHGHSRKMGAFVYGCKTHDELESRQIAWILSRLNSKVLFEECEFGLSQFKKQTARGIMSDIVVMKKSMTLETSFYGYRTIGSKHWEVRDLQKIGATLIEAIYAQSSKDPKLFNWQTLKLQLKQALENSQSPSKSKIKRENSESSFGSDSNPSQDEMTDKEKAEHFLDPTIALKIGLNQVRIVRKSREIDSGKLKGMLKVKGKEDKLEPIDKYQMIVDGFKEKLDFLMDKSDMLTPNNEDTERNLRQKGTKEVNFMVRHSRSTTKILPFKFSQKLQRPSLEKRNRKSVQILIKRPQKLSVPDLPRVETKNNFWSNLKKQYEVLLTERKRKDIL